MKCDRCGLQSDVEQAFSTEKSLLRKPKHFCPDCTVKRESRWLVFGLAILALSGLLNFAIDPFSGVTSVVLGSILILLFMIPLVIIHELAHAGAAKLVGLRVFGITIGTGKTIWSGKFLGMDWTINILPLAGITMAGARPLPHSRWRLFFTYLAGPASHIPIALGLFFLEAALPQSRWDLIFIPLIVTNILLAAISLFPHTASTVVGMQGSDGWHLFRVPFMKQSELIKQHVGYFSAEAMQSYAAKDFNRAESWLQQAFSLDANSGTARNIQGIIQMARGEYGGSRQTFLQLLETEEARAPGLHYILLNNIAYLDALLRDPSLLPEADQFSAEALKHLPWLPAITGTRGTVLVELGQLDEGIALLKRSMSLSPDKQAKALNACHIAIGELRRGNLEGARKYLVSAKTLDASCFLIPYVEVQMTESRTMDDGQ